MNYSQIFNSYKFKMYLHRTRIYDFRRNSSVKTLIGWERIAEQMKECRPSCSIFVVQCKLFQYIQVKNNAIQQKKVHWNK